MSDLIYGRNTEQVIAFIERCKVLTDDEIEKIATAHDAAWSAAPAWSAAWHTAREAAWSAHAAIVVMDLITAEQFAILTEPFAEILAELGIVWKASEASK